MGCSVETVTLYQWLGVFIVIFSCLFFIYTNQKKGKHCDVKPPPFPESYLVHLVHTEHTFCLKYWQAIKICRTPGYLEICASKVIDGFSMLEGFKRQLPLIRTYHDLRYHNNRLQKNLERP